PHEVNWTTLQAFYQIAMDVLLALLWFCMYLPGSAFPWRTAKFVLCTLPALGFALAMRDLYNPAVFFMGLTAVFVAAEHFGSLEHSAKRVARQARLLGKQGGSLKEQTRLVKAQAEALKRQGESLEDQTLLVKAQAEALERQGGSLEEQTQVLR